MELELKREYKKWGTIGLLRLADGAVLNTLELPYKDNKVGVSCIKEGRYRVTKSHFYGGKNKGKKAFRLHNVEGRSGILIHIANYLSQLNGCIAVGKSRQGQMITSSRLAFNELWSKTPSEFYLNVREDVVKKIGFEIVPSDVPKNSFSVSDFEKDKSLEKSYPKSQKKGFKGLLLPIVGLLFVKYFWNER